MSVVDTAGLKPPPKFVTNEWAWAHTLDRLAEKDQLDAGGNPRNYGAAVAIYKNVVKKYGDQDPLADAGASTETLTRADILEFDARIWVVGRGGRFAYSANDAAYQRVFCDERAGWQLERTMDGLKRTVTIDRELVEWLMRDNDQAGQWVRLHG